MTSVDKVGYPQPWLDRITLDTGDHLRAREGDVIGEVAIGGKGGVAATADPFILQARAFVDEKRKHRVMEGKPRSHSSSVNHK